MRYQNPILSGDYSDPDVVHAGENRYRVSSSLPYLPGIPVLHSRDLVHRRLIGCAARSLPFARYDAPGARHGGGARPGRFAMSRAIFGGYADVACCRFTPAENSGV